MERFVSKLISFLSCLVFRSAGEVHRRPAFAIVFYVTALAGVLASTFGRGAGRPAEPDSAQTRLLRGLEEEGTRVVERRYRPGDEVYSPGDSAGSLYFLLSGTVRAYKTYGNLREATTAFLKDEGVFGVLDLKEEGTQREFAEAVTEARVLTVRKSTVAWLVKRSPEASLALFSTFVDRGRQTDELHDLLLRREVVSRLAKLLLNLGERFGEQAEEAGAVKIDLGLTHRQLADMIASTREAVSKAMIELRCEGLIDVRDHRRIVLIDVPALSDRAESGLALRGSQAARR
jgi:CRP/FNR family transcriptional regulator, global nitrogen regulator